VGKTAKYVLESIESHLGPSHREKRFSWARGDVSPKTNRASMLPFDAVWEQHKLIVEVHEDQHRRPNTHFDKPQKLTCSGVHRGIQRKIYDARKKSAAEANGYKVVVIEWSRSKRKSSEDADEVWKILTDTVSGLTGVINL
jgi:hypothetical protein